MVAVILKSLCAGRRLKKRTVANVFEIRKVSIVSRTVERQAPFLDGVSDHVSFQVTQTSGCKACLHTFYCVCVCVANDNNSYRL